MITNWIRKKSAWFYHFNAGGCNNCDIELLDCLAPRFDVERFGISFTGTPRHADILIITGPVTKHAAPYLKKVYQEIPKPCVVAAVGACGCSGGIFKDSYNVVGPVDRLIPVDVYIPGCPPKPETIISGVLRALENFEEKKGMK